MAITRAGAATTNEQAGIYLYEILVRRLGDLSASEQLAIGLALQDRKAWAKLSPAARRALVLAAGDLGGA